MKTQPSAQRFKYTVVAARAAPAHDTDAATAIAIRIRMRGSLAGRVTDSSAAAARKPRRHIGSLKPRT